VVDLQLRYLQKNRRARNHAMASSIYKEEEEEDTIQNHVSCAQ
jgi:hypothetical protein